MAAAPGAVAIGAGGEEGRGPVGIDLARLRAAIQAALTLCGLDYMKDAMGLYISGAQQRLLTPWRAIDLSVVWHPLRDDPTIPQGQAASTLLLLSLYLEHGMKVAVQIPDEARRPMDDALTAMVDLEQRTARLIQLTNEVLRGQTASSMSQMPVSGDSARASGRMTAANRVVRPPSVAAAPRQRFRLRDLRVQDIFLGIMSLLVITLLGGYWAWELWLRPPPQAPFQSEVSEIIPVKSYRIVGKRMVVVLSDDAFFEWSPDAQQALAKNLLRLANTRLGAPGTDQVVAVSSRKADLNVTVSPQSHPPGPTEVP